METWWGTHDKPSDEGLIYPLFGYRIQRGPNKLKPVVPKSPLFGCKDPLE